MTNTMNTTDTTDTAAARADRARRIAYHSRVNAASARSALDHARTRLWHGPRRAALNAAWAAMADAEAAYIANPTVANSSAVNAADEVVEAAKDDLARAVNAELVAAEALVEECERLAAQGIANTAEHTAALEACAALR